MDLEERRNKLQKFIEIRRCQIIIIYKAVGGLHCVTGESKIAKRLPPTYTKKHPYLCRLFLKNHPNM